MSRLWMFCACWSVFGQSAVKPFEAASIRVHNTPTGVIDIRPAGNRLNVIATMPRGLVTWAYHVPNFRLVQTPALQALGDTMYDIIAKAEGEGTHTKDEFREMLKLLLADRFKLAAHWEKREMPVYALVIGKNGPKLKPGDSGARKPWTLHVAGRDYEVTAPNTDMDGIVDAIMNSFPDRPVVDRTGLTGTYDLRLTYTPQTRGNAASPDPGDLNIFTAVQEQLGLKLEPRKEALDVLIVDHMEKPGEN